MVLNLNEELRLTFSDASVDSKEIELGWHGRKLLKEHPS